MRASCRVVSLGLGLSLLSAPQLSAAQLAQPFRPPAPASRTGQGHSGGPQLSRDGRHVVFTSSAPNLVTNDVNGHVRDVFVRDLLTGVTRLVSITPTGVSGDGPSDSAVISADGRFVAFVSRATDLVSGDTNRVADVFLRDLDSGITVCASRNTNGVPGNGESAEPFLTPSGQWLGFESRASDLAPGDTNLTWDVFAYDRVASQVSRYSVPSTLPELGSLPPGPSRRLHVSDAAETSAFLSDARNLAPTLPVGGAAAYANNLFVVRSSGGPLSMVNLVPGPLAQSLTLFTRSVALSQDGRALASLVVSSLPATLAPGFYWTDLDTGEVYRPEPNLVAVPYDDLVGPFLSADGQKMIYEGRETGSGPAVYLARVHQAATTRVSGPPNSASANTNAIGRLLGASRDCEFAAFIGRSSADPDDAAYREQIIVARIATGEQRRISRHHDGTPFAEVGLPGISFSADGHRLVFQSLDSAVETGDLNGSSDVFLYDWDTDRVQTLSVAAAALPSLTGLGRPAVLPRSLSADGGRIAVTTAAALDPVDTNGVTDVYVLDRAGNTARLVSAIDGLSAAGNGPSRDAVISADGRFVAFVSGASNLVGGDTNRVDDVFLRDMLMGFVEIVSYGGNGPHGELIALGGSRPAISPDGRWVAFESRSAGIVPGVASGVTQIYLYDRTDKRIRLVSANAAAVSGGGAGDSTRAVFSPDSRWLVFESQANNLLLPVASREGYVYAMSVDDRSLRLLTPANSQRGTTALRYEPIATFDPAGRVVAFMQKGFGLAGARPLYLFDFATGKAEQVAENARMGGISLGATRLAYRTYGLSPVSPAQVRLRDRAAGAETNVADVGVGGSGSVALTPDGRFVVFTGITTNVVSGATVALNNVFLSDLVAGTTVLLSATPQGKPGDGPSGSFVMSSDGSTVVFSSFAGDLADGDYNRQLDLFSVRLPGAESDFRVTSITRLATGEVTLIWAATPGKTYQVEASYRLPGEWHALALTIRIDGSQASATHFTGLPSPRQLHSGAGAPHVPGAPLPYQFYRILELP